MREVLGEVNGVLAGTAADFEHVPTVSENFAQYGEDWVFVLFAGFGKTLHM